MNDEGLGAHVSKGKGDLHRIALENRLEGEDLAFEADRRLGGRCVCTQNNEREEQAREQPPPPPGKARCPNSLERLA